MENMQGTAQHQDGMKMESHEAVLHAGYLESFLFPGTSTTIKASFILACLATMAAAFLMEIIKFALRSYQEKKTHLKLVTCDICHHSPSYLTFPSYNLNSMPNSSDESRNESQNNLVSVSEGNCGIKKLCSWFILGFGQFFISFAALLLMLLAMSMNVYVLLALAGGTSIGHLAVVWYQQKESKEK